MKDRLFIFLGCSWVYGKFINWELNAKNTPDVDPLFEAEQARLHSFRSLLVNHYDVDHVSFAEGGSSNERQFRFASEFFLQTHNNSDFARTQKQYNLVRASDWPDLNTIEDFKLLSEPQLDECALKNVNVPDWLERISRYKDVTVFWFITSTHRREMYNGDVTEYDNFFLSDMKNPVVRARLMTELIVKQGYYSVDEELKKLAAQKQLWNSYFKSCNIRNLWFDTFNHYDWPVTVDNQFDFGTEYTDIMSNMYVAIKHEKPKKNLFHFSIWEADEERSQLLVETGHLNPVTLHPTVKGHKLISDLMISRLDYYLNLK